MSVSALVGDIPVTTASTLLGPMRGCDNFQGHTALTRMLPWLPLAHILVWAGWRAAPQPALEAGGC